MPEHAFKHDPGMAASLRCSASRGEKGETNMQNVRMWWLSVVFVVMVSSCGSGKKDSAPEEKTPARASSKQAQTVFSIPAIKPIDATETETRLVVGYPKDDRSKLLFKMQSPNYQLEMGAAKTPGMGGERGFLYWAPGAVHEWADGLLDKPKEMSATGSRMRPAGYEIINGKKYFGMSKAFTVLTGGFAESPNKLEGWQVVQSNPANPLTFKLLKEKGYTYLCGEGIVKDPDGKPHSLGPGSIEDWISGLKSTNATDREASALALGWLGRGKKDVTKALVASLGDGDTIVRRSVIEALGRIGDPDALGSLNSLTTDHGWTEETLKWARDRIEKAKTRR